MTEICDTHVQRLQTDNDITWIIENYCSHLDVKVHRFIRLVEGPNKSMSWLITLCKRQNSDVTFQVSKVSNFQTDPNPVKVKLAIGTIVKQEIFSFIGKTYTTFSYSVRSNSLLPLVSPDGSIQINIKIKLLTCSIENESVSKRTNFKSFLNNQSHSDVVFKIDEQEIPAHKVIIANASSIFDKKFFHQTESTTVIDFVKIKGVDPNVFKEFLNYIYTDRVANLESMAFGLYDLANKYGTPGLQAICEEHFDDTFNADNVINILYLADRNNSVNLKNKCFEFINTNFEKVQETESFKYLKRGLLLELFRATRMKKSE